MSHPKQHKTKWTVYFTVTGGVLRFNDEEDARSMAMLSDTPARLIEPLYY